MKWSVTAENLRNSALKVMTMADSASEPKVHGFKPNRGRLIFKGNKKSIAKLPSEGK
jgi:hypothetical protein